MVYDYNGGHPIHIYSDIQSALEALNCCKFSVLERRDTPGVLGHCGIDGNQKADDLARKAYSTP